MWRPKSGETAILVKYLDLPKANLAQEVGSPSGADTIRSNMNLFHVSVNLRTRMFFIGNLISAMSFQAASERRAGSAAPRLELAGLAGAAGETKGRTRAESRSQGARSTSSGV